MIGIFLTFLGIYFTLKAYNPKLARIFGIIVLCTVLLPVLIVATPIYIFIKAYKWVDRKGGKAGRFGWLGIAMIHFMVWWWLIKNIFLIGLLSTPILLTLTYVFLYAAIKHPDKFEEAWRRPRSEIIDEIVYDAFGEKKY